MKVLLLAYGSYLRRTAVASGNSVRAYALARALAEAGCTVVHVYPAHLREGPGSDGLREEGVRVLSYGSREDLRRLLERERPDVLLLGYWELASDLPTALPMPLVLDVVAPRVLEALHEGPEKALEDIPRQLRAYGRGDLFLVGNERQRHLLLPWLILAGFDCRERDPVLVLPISGCAGDARRPPPVGAPWTFVSGGVSWPWRRSERYFEAVSRAVGQLAGGGRLLLLAGKYVYGEDASGAAPDRPFADPPHVQRTGLVPYGELERLLGSECHVGVELAELNTERYYSQSFRSVEFLRFGLPIVCNDYLEISALVREYDAGWLVKGPEELETLIPEIVGDPAGWALKSANALRLVRERLDYRRNAAPLVEFLRSPARASRAKPTVQVRAVPGGAGTRDGGTVARGPHRRLIGAAGRVTRGLCRLAAPRPVPGAVAIISRQDIFPTDHGAAVKIERTAWGLSLVAGTVAVVTDDRRSYWLYERGHLSQGKYPRWLSRLGKDESTLEARLTALGVPASDAFLYYPLVDWSFVARTLYVGWRHGVRAYQAEFPAYARPALWARALLGGTALLVEHNVEYDRLWSQSSNMSLRAYGFLRNNEISLCNQCDAVVAVSEPDRVRLVADGVEPARVHYIPHGVDLDAFDRATPRDVRGELGIPPDQPLLVFHGIYLYPPNLEAMEVMAREILPRIRAAGVRPKVLAIGRSPPPVPLDPDILFLGSVPELAPYLLAADLAVVPLQKGGGTRMKILEYFAAGLPVVSTAKGIEGIPATNGVHAIIEDDFERFAGAVVSLVHNRARAQALGRAARAFVEPLGWTAIAKRYWALIEEAVQGSAGVATGHPAHPPAVSGRAVSGS